MSHDDLERAFIAKHKGDPVTMGVLLGVVNRIAATMGTRVAALEERLKDVERRPTIRDAGIWHVATVYKAGDIVTHQGSGWICSADHVAGDTIDHSRFRLLVKKGADARDAR